MKGGRTHFVVVTVANLCPTLCDSIVCSMPGLPVFHYLPEFAQTHVHWVSDTSQHLILCSSLILLPSIFPSIKGFSNESVLRIRWPNYWSFNFSISPSNEYLELISFRIDWLFLVAVQRLFFFFFIFKLYKIVLVLPNIKMNPPQTLKSLLQPTIGKHPFFISLL